MITLPKLYSQVDPQYASTPIGFSTIGAIGCLTVDAAMICCYFGHMETPESLANKMKTVGGYQGNLWVWTKLSQLYPDMQFTKFPQASDIVDPLTDAQMNEIREAIDKGYPVFIKIETSVIPEHWVLAVGYNGDDLQVANPLSFPAQVHPISNWGIPPKKIIYNYGWYTGPIVQPTTSDYPDLSQYPKFAKVYEQLVTNSDKYGKVLQAFGIVTSTDTTPADEVIQQLTKLKDQVATLLKESENKSKIIDELQKDINELEHPKSDIPPPPSTPAEGAVLNKLKGAMQKKNEAPNQVQDTKTATQKNVVGAITQLVRRFFHQLLIIHW